MSLADRSPRYASRLNAFRVSAWAGQGHNAVTIRDLIQRAASAGLNAADLYYPNHFEDDSPADLAGVLRSHGMSLNGLAMRYYSLPEFRLGAFTHPEPAVRDAAIDLTRRGIDAIRRVCDHNPGVDIAIEYKPNEPRAFALMPDLGATLLAIRPAERDNLALTLEEVVHTSPPA